MITILYILLAGFDVYAHAPDNDIANEPKQLARPQDYFYSKKDFDKTILNMKESINSIWLITASVNIICIQLGFSLLEVGSIHHKNTTNILYKNLVDTFFGALGFYMFGYAFSNKASGGLFGYWKFFCLDLTKDEYL